MNADLNHTSPKKLGKSAGKWWSQKERHTTDDIIYLAK